MDANNITDSDNVDNTSSYIRIVTYVISIVIVVIFSFLEHNIQGRRPGVAIPVDLLSDDSLIYAYAAAFGCTSSSIVRLITDSNNQELFSDISEDVKPWVRFPLWLMFAVFISFKFYPIFAAIRHETPIIGSVLGFVHCSVLIGQHTFNIVQSERQSFSTSVIVIDLPILVCFAILLVYFAYRGITDILILRQGTMAREELLRKKKSNRFERLYIKWILFKDTCSKNKTVDESLKSKLDSYKTEVKEKLKTNTPLRTSPRVIVTFVVSAIVLLQVGVIIFSFYKPLRNFAVLSLAQTLENGTFYQYFKTALHVADVSFYTSLLISTVLMAVYGVLIYMNYQQDIQRMYRGDFSFIPQQLRNQNAKTVVANSLRYSGTQIAYMFWCYIILFLTVFVACVGIAYLLILPLMGKVPIYFMRLIQYYAPIFFATYIFRWLQILIVNRYFLQNHFLKTTESKKGDRALSLRNRKMFNIFSFFMFFFHVIIGFVGCINRILKGAALGILTVARIDRSLLPSGWEHLDVGYTTYVGLIMLELYHRNPILLVFCDELLNAKTEKLQEVSLYAPDENRTYQRSVSDNLSREKRLRLRNKWFKAYTIVNNPSLIETVKGRMKRGFSEQTAPNLNDFSEA